MERKTQWITITVEGYTKIGELEGVRNLTRIECSCGAVWIRYGNKAFDKRERQQFIAKHWEHEVKLVRKWQKQK